MTTVTNWRAVADSLTKSRDEGSVDGLQSTDRPELTVIVPVLNEMATIAELLRRVLAAPYRKQVIVVDDGSSDGTVEVLEAWEGHPEVELLAHSRNRGKGAAIRTALENALGRFTIIQDADLEYDPQDYPRLIEPLLSGEAQVVYGSRNIDRRRVRGRPWSLFGLGVLVLNLCVRILYGLRVTDEATCYKAFPTALLRAMNLECERFEFCPEVTAKASRMGLTIREVAIAYAPRNAREGKKIRWTDGLEALATLWKYRKWQPAAGMDQRLHQAGEIYRAREGLADVCSTGFSRNPGEEPPKGGTTNGAFPAAGEIARNHRSTDIRSVV